MPESDLAPGRKNFGRSLKSRLIYLFGAVLAVIVVVYWVLVLTIAFALSADTLKTRLDNQLTASGMIIRSVLEAALRENLRLRLVSASPDPSRWLLSTEGIRLATSGKPVENLWSRTDADGRYYIQGLVSRAVNLGSGETGSASWREKTAQSGEIMSRYALFQMERPGGRVEILDGRLSDAEALIDPAVLRPDFDRLLTGPDNSIEIVDGKGAVLFHSSAKFEGTLPDKALYRKIKAETSGELVLSAPVEVPDAGSRLPSALKSKGWLTKTYRFRRIEGTSWTICVGSAAPDLIQTMNSPVILAIGMNLLFVGMIMAMIFVGLRRLVLARLSRLQETMDRFGTMDFDARVQDGILDEIGTLGERFNRMAEIVQAYHRVMENQAREIIDERNSLRIKNEQISKDLELARTIQDQLIPKTGPVPELTFRYRPMEMVGGDFFDFIAFRNSPLFGIFISDVSGHGVPAAFVTTMIKSQLLQAAPYIKSPAYLLRIMNDNLSGKTGGNFVTAFYGIYDPVSRELTYSSAGHNPPFVTGKGGVRTLPNPGNGIPLGVSSSSEIHMMGRDWGNGKVSLSPGDKLVLYTDGLTEAAAPCNENGACEEYGDAALSHILSLHQDAGGPELTDRIIDGLADFCGGTTYEDDVCLVVLEVLPE